MADIPVPVEAAVAAAPSLPNMEVKQIPNATQIEVVKPAVIPPESVTLGNYLDAQVTNFNKAPGDAAPEAMISRLANDQELIKAGAVSISPENVLTGRPQEAVDMNEKFDARVADARSQLTNIGLSDGDISGKSPEEIIQQVNAKKAEQRAAGQDAGGDWKMDEETKGFLKGVGAAAQKNESSAPAVDSATPALQNPGEFNEAAVRKHIELNNPDFSAEEIDAKVAESRKSHNQQVEQYNQQQAPKTPEQIRDAILSKKQKGEALTNDDIRELNAAKMAIKERDELATLEKRMSDPDDALDEDEMTRYHVLKEKSENAAKPTSAETRKSLEDQSQQIVDKIRNGEGDLLQNVLDLENVQRQLTIGQKLSKSMMKRLGDALQTSIESGELENDEAEKVIDKIGELYGLEMQMAQLPEYYDKLEKDADKLDAQIDKGKKVKFDKSPESQKKRMELYNSYTQLTLVEAQMAQLSVANLQLMHKFNTVMNQVDFTLGRQNLYSYAMNGLSNAGSKHLLNRVTPRLRSTRHRNLIGF